MPTLDPYLIFPGTCREALAFYADALEGRTTLLETYAEAPFAVQVDDAGRVFNAIFRGDGIRFRASDHLRSQSLSKGERLALFLAYSSREEQQRAFDGLADGGRVLMPLVDGFGMVEDRYGVRWMLGTDS